MNTITLAAKKLAHLEKDLFDNYLASGSVSLMTGKGGLPLLYYNLYQATGNGEYQEKAGTVLEHLVDQVSEGLHSLSYCDGLAGFAYLLNYMREKDFVDDSIDDLLADCDGILREAMHGMLETDNIDYLHGAQGIAIYCLDRYKAGYMDKGRVDAIAGAIINRVNKEAEDKSAPRYINCGMAHGLLASIMLLSKYCSVMSEAEPAKAAVRSGVELLLKFRSANAAGLSVFPSIVKVEGSAFDTTYDIPLGWCYGDTVVSVGLHYAAQMLNDRTLADYALQLALQTMNRNTRKSALVFDACFCHGSAGISHIYKKWHRHTGLAAFENGYRQWIEQTVELGSFEDGIGGYKKFQGGEYSKEFGLLDGACGVAMVLTDFTYDGHGDWDRFFLLS